MPIISNVDSNITKNLSQAEKELGVDLKLTKDGDLEISNLKDFKLVAGGANAAQAIFINLGLEPKSLLQHPELGVSLGIGDKNKSAFEIKTQILRSLRKNPKFAEVEVNVTILGNTVVNEIRVRLINTDVTIPLKFLSER